MSNKETSDEQVYSILKDEFFKAEQALQENLEDLLMKRASRTVLNGEVYIFQRYVVSYNL